MRRNRLGIVSALVSALFALTVICPCPTPAASDPPTPSSSHDCCASEEGLRAAAADCCAAEQAPPSAVTVSAPAPVVLALAAVDLSTLPPATVTARAPGLPLDAAPSPPPVLRI